MKMYGINKSDAKRYPDPFGMDVSDIQNVLPSGARIRNKKQKRRYEKKRARQAARIDTAINTLDNTPYIA